MKKIIVIGGHGKIARLATPLLLADGHEVTSVIRNPDQAGGIMATGGVPLVADIEALDTEALTALLDGQEVVVWSAGAGGGNPARTRAVDHDAAIRSMDAAAQAGVRHYVMVSYYGSRPDHGIDADNGFWHYAEAKAAADEYLRASSLAWTILAPSSLTLDTPSGSIDAQLGRGPQQGDAQQVSRSNVALVIAAVVTAGGPLETTIAFNDGSTTISEAIFG